MLLNLVDIIDTNKILHKNNLYLLHFSIEL